MHAGRPSDSPHHPDYVPSLFAHKKDKKAAVFRRLQRASSRSLAREVYGELEPVGTRESFTSLVILKLTFFGNEYQVMGM